MTAATHETPAREMRLAQARAALTAAERSAARWGGRIDRTALHPAASEPNTGALLPVPHPLGPLFPGAGVRVGSSVAVQGAAATSVLLALAAAATGEDAWCAIAGMPDLGLRSALEIGVDPCRLALAPAQGDQHSQVLSALADGVGVLVLGPDLDIAPALWRTLSNRARAADTLVLAACPPGRTDITLRTAARGWIGLGQGSGRLRQRRVHIVSTGRGIAGQQEAQVLLPQASGRISAMRTAQAAHNDLKTRVALRPLQVAG